MILLVNQIKDKKNGGKKAMTAISHIILTLTRCSFLITYVEHNIIYVDINKKMGTYVFLTKSRDDRQSAHIHYLLTKYRSAL